jgi:hypothetical protein
MFTALCGNPWGRASSIERGEGDSARLWHMRGSYDVYLSSCCATVVILGKIPHVNEVSTPREDLFETQILEYWGMSAWGPAGGAKRNEFLPFPPNLDTHNEDRNQPHIESSMNSPWLLFIAECNANFTATRMIHVPRPVPRGIQGGSCQATLSATEGESSIDRSGLALWIQKSRANVLGGIVESGPGQHQARRLLSA